MILLGPVQNTAQSRYFLHSVPLDSVPRRRQDAASAVRLVLAVGTRPSALARDPVPGK